MLVRGSAMDSSLQTRKYLLYKYVSFNHFYFDSEDMS
jgi:hypothetical protein